MNHIIGGGTGGHLPPNFTVEGALPPLFPSPVHIIYRLQLNTAVS